MTFYCQKFLLCNWSLLKFLGTNFAQTSHISKFYVRIIVSLLIFSSFSIMLIVRCQSFHAPVPQLFRIFNQFCCYHTAKSAVKLSLVPFFGKLFTPFQNMCSWYNSLPYTCFDIPKTLVDSFPSLNKNFVSVL